MKRGVLGWLIAAGSWAINCVLNLCIGNWQMALAGGCVVVTSLLLAGCIQWWGGE